MLLGNCTATRIKELFPSGNLKELLFSQFIQAWHYLEHSYPKDQPRRGKENGHFFYNVENSTTSKNFCCKFSLRKIQLVTPKFKCCTIAAGVFLLAALCQLFEKKLQEEIKQAAHRGCYGHD